MAQGKMLVAFSSLWSTLWLAAPAAVAGPVNLTELRAIVVPAEPAWQEALAGKILKELLGRHYGLTLEVVAAAPGAGRHAIYLGRASVLAAGMVSAEELEAVKYDGYVVLAGDGRIGVAGYRPLGTLFGTYALLGRLGIRLYPHRSNGVEGRIPGHSMWEHGGQIEVFTPLPDRKLPAMKFAERPAFQFRNIRADFNQGRFGGGSYMDKGDVRTAADQEFFGTRSGRYCSSEHTAGYLVPRELYAAAHPEYYGLKADGTPMPTDSYHRTILRTVNPDVRRITAERLAEWMDIQNDRRFFYVCNGDARLCKAPESIAADPLPHYCTDREIQWVNHAAVAAAKTHPDKKVLTLCYIETVKPPVLVKPAPNVIAMYAPWMWLSANTREATFSHPANYVAAEEFVGWNLCCPNQVGVFDYAYPPMLWLRGLVDRIKAYAKIGAVAIELDGGPLPFEDLCHYVISWQMWDPTLDSVELQDEFLKTFYGPAAGPISNYFRVHHEVSYKTLGEYYKDEQLMAAARGLFRQAEQAAQGNDAYLLRVQQSVFRWLDSGLSHRLSYLSDDSRYGLAPVTRSRLDEYQQDVRWHLELGQRLIQTCNRIAGRPSEWLAKSTEGDIKAALSRLGAEVKVNLVQAAGKDQSSADAAWMDAAMKQVAEHLAKYETPEKAVPTQAPPVTIWRPTNAEEARSCSVECTLGELALLPTIGEVAGPTGQTWHGLTAKLPLTKLPVVDLHTNPKGVSTMHAGTFLLKTAFAKPVDIGGRPFINLAVHASAAVPITVYLDTTAGRLRSDIYLHAGYQIVRIDTRLHRRNWRGFRDWDGRLAGLKLDVWPQDNFYPYPATRDVTLTLLDVTARSDEPDVKSLPFAGEAVWLSNFRPNIPHGLYRFSNEGTTPPLVGTQHLRTVDGTLDYERYTAEGFRTCTPHGSLSPIFAIVTRPDRPQAERTAVMSLQFYLEQVYGVKLPINPPGLTAGPDVGNVILVGRDAAERAGLVSEPELKRAGGEGYVIKSRHGRIALAGSTETGTANAVGRFLAEQGLGLRFAGGNETLTDAHGDGMLDPSGGHCDLCPHRRARRWYAARDVCAGLAVLRSQTSGGWLATGLTRPG